MNEKIESEQTVIIEALQEIKDSGGDHAEFYESLQARQNEIVRELEEMMETEDADEN